MCSHYLYGLERAQLHVSCDYYCSMTGVGGRPEILIIGSNSLEGPWEVRRFTYVSFYQRNLILYCIEVILFPVAGV